MNVLDHATIRPRSVDARERVGGRLAGLHRRITRTRAYLANPWIRLGAAVGVGYLLDRSERPELAPGPRRHGRRELTRPETIVHSLVRAALVTVVTSTIRRAICGSTTEATR